MQERRGLQFIATVQKWQMCWQKWCFAKHRKTDRYDFMQSALLKNIVQLSYVSL